VFYSLGSDPLQLWDKRTREGNIDYVQDNVLRSKVLELSGENVANNYIVCPKDPKRSLGITLPHFVLLVRNLGRFFTFEVQIMDDKGARRRFRASNFQSTTRVKPYICTMPLQLDDGWNQIHLDLASFTKRAYGTNYSHTVQVQIHSNCRIRRVYFAEKILSDDELPAALKLFSPE